MIRKLVLSLATLALVAACNPNAAPQASISGEQRAQLEGLVHTYLDAASQANAQGFAPTPDIQDQIASLQPNADNRREISLAGGVSYRILGVCDNECSNVDMELLDSTGAVIGSDVLDDDVPIVNITPPAAGRYTVRLILKTCTLAPCYVGARVLQQAAPAPQPVMAPGEAKPIAKQPN